MIQITPQMRILLAVAPVDFRNGIDGLAGLCRQVLATDPMAGALIVFCSRSRRALKLLVYDVSSNFPEECRHVLESIRDIYHLDAQAKEQNLSPDQRLQFHQVNSQPRLEALQIWLQDQFDQKKVEPNSGLGSAIGYMLKRWESLTLFLREAGAPLDNNITERALKMAIQHRKNSLSFKTERGAEVGDLFMSIIHRPGLPALVPPERWPGL